MFTAEFGLQRIVMESNVTWTLLPVSYGYDMGMGVEYVSDTCTQFKHFDPLDFLTFGRKKRSQ